MPFIRKVRVLFKTRLIFPRINGPIVLNMAKKMISLSYTVGHSCFLFVLSRVLWGLRSSPRISHIGKLKLSFIVRNILHYGSKVLITYQGTIKIGYTPVEPRVVPIRVVDIGT